MPNTTNPLFSSKVLVNLGGAFSLALGFSVVKPEEAKAKECDLLDQGGASWYGDPEMILDKFQGKKTASGDKFNTYEMTAAHKTLPFGTKVIVERTNGKDVEVTITDRGPYEEGRIIDLSWQAANALDIIGPGSAPVKVFEAC